VTPPQANVEQVLDIDASGDPPQLAHRKSNFFSDNLGPRCGHATFQSFYPPEKGKSYLFA
jgi:hypothetical protein